MTGKELLETYPKAANIIREWFAKKMIEALPTADVPEDFKEFMKERGVSDNTLYPLFDKNPSALFEVFDSQGVYIVIPINIDSKEPSFTYKIFMEGMFWTAPETGLARREAEIKAVETAMKQINERGEISVTKEVK